eukprot:CAMPEP_0116148076 /NCGR_PEP_ID=MMETSP0329-20121206/18136_1 /TAXON_ID=697910 /ORGANISM="Pseudo-nitzschia arenysensis, Strain B593" /LENGTH=877 /DNA_ID=CAMNT_0003644129 /DNA_START=241 /DNA_END=2874 /DNA_ORIENTATION=+
MAGNQGNVEFESNSNRTKLAFSEESSKSDAAAAAAKAKHYNSEDSDIASSNDSSNPQQNLQQMAVKRSGFAEYEQQARGKGRTTLDETTVSEADEILQNFSDSSKQESAEEVAAEAEDIMSGFSGSKDESSASSSSSSSSSSGPTEFELGLGNSTSSSGSDKVLMDQQQDDDGDIGLDELFETAAALDVTLETEHSARAGATHVSPDESTSAEFDSMGVESNSSLSCSTIEEEHTESIEAEQTTNEEDGASSSDEESPKKKTKAAAAVTVAATTTTTAVAVAAAKGFSAPRSFQPTIAEAAPAVLSNTRTLLYDTDDDEETGISEAVAAAPMPWFSAVPYSTGKWKKTQDGMSVVSDDISYSGGAPVLPSNHHLPYTVQNKNYQEPAPPPSRFQKKHWILIALGVLLLLIAAILLGVYASDQDPKAPTTIVISDNNNNNNNNNNNANIDTEYIRDVVATGTVAPSTVSSTAGESSSQDFVEETATPEPTDPPTSVTTTPQDVVNFEATSVLTGLQGSDMLGSVVSMTGNGKYLATLSDSFSNPVRVFVRDGEAWFPLPEIPRAEKPKYGPSNGDGSNVVAALTDSGDLVVAISSFAQVEVYVYAGGYWTPKGEILYWDTPRGISHISMDLSRDGDTLALGLVDAPGTTIATSVFTYDDYYESWGDALVIDHLAHRDATQRSVRPEEGTILAIDVKLSGDGNVLALAEWDVGSPEVIVQTFEREAEDYWVPMGDPMHFLYGPVSMALSEYGYRFVVVAEHPGKGTALEWNGKKWSFLGGNSHGFLPGGSSVAMALEGTRILIGDAGSNTATILDYDEDFTYYYSAEEWSSWAASVSLAGQGDYGTSVTMNAIGNVFGVGAPNSGQNSSGQVTMYGKSQ